MKVVEELDLTAYNSYNLKTSCRNGFFPENQSDIMEFFRDRKDGFEVIGAGNNIIFSKEYYDRDFLIIGSSFNCIKLISKDTVVAQAGATMREICMFALEHNLKGLENFYDIPSSVGGAIVMNAGASGVDINDILLEVEYYDSINQKLTKKSVDQLKFDYRSSMFQNEKSIVILTAMFKLKFDSQCTIKKKMEALQKERWLKQPREYPNAGSVFKRPKGYFVGQLIEELGLKGYQIGGAQISEKHGGFIVNKKNASGKDIIDLIEFIQKEVKDKVGIQLEIEQRII